MNGREIYKSARAYGYRHMRRFPQHDRVRLIEGMRKYLEQVAFVGQHIPDAVLKEAAGHISYVVSSGKIEQAIQAPQGKPSATEQTQLMIDYACFGYELMPNYEHHVGGFLDQIDQ